VRWARHLRHAHRPTSARAYTTRAAGSNCPPTCQPSALLAKDVPALPVAVSAALRTSGYAKGSRSSCDFGYNHLMSVTIATWLRINTPSRAPLSSPGATYAAMALAAVGPPGAAERSLFSSTKPIILPEKASREVHRLTLHIRSRRRWLEVSRSQQRRSYPRRPCRCLLLGERRCAPFSVVSRMNTGHPSRQIHRRGNRAG